MGIILFSYFCGQSLGIVTFADKGFKPLKKRHLWIGQFYFMFEHVTFSLVLMIYM